MELPTAPLSRGAWAESLNLCISRSSSSNELWGVLHHYFHRHHRSFASARIKVRPSCASKLDPQQPASTRTNSRFHRGCSAPSSRDLDDGIARALFPAGFFRVPCEASSTRPFRQLQIRYQTVVCFGGGPRPKRPRIWKTHQRRGTVNKSQKLLERVRSLSNVKEEVYGALDEFIAWEIEFPIIAVKKALHSLKLEKDWKRIIQICKWMIGKGQGKTLGTYLLLLEAFDAEGRIEEAHELWQKVFTAYMECTPRDFFSQVISMYDRHKMQNELLEVFADMEELEVKPNKTILNIVASTYEKLGDFEKAEKVRTKFQPKLWIYRTINGRKIKFRNKSISQDGGLKSLEGRSRLEMENNSYKPGMNLEETSLCSSDMLYGSSQEDDFTDYDGAEDQECVQDSDQSKMSRTRYNL